MRKTYNFFAQMLALSAFCDSFGVNFWEEKPRSQPINLPTKGIKGMTNAELNANKCGKNKRKRRRK